MSGKNVANYNTFGDTQFSNIIVQGGGLSIFGADSTIPIFSFNPTTRQVTLDSDVNITGSTTTSTINVSEFDGGIFGVAATNTADAIDLGISGKYINGVEQYTGIARIASDVLKRWTFFDYIATQPVNTINGVSGPNEMQLAPIRASSVYLNNGTAELPSIVFDGNTIKNTGFYRIGADNIGITTGGINRVDIDNTRTNFATGQIVNIGTSGTTSPLNVYGLITGSNGLTVSSGVTSLQGVNATTLTASGLITANAGLTGTSLTVTGNINSLTQTITGSTSGVITIQAQDAAGTYNYILPITAGTAGQFLTSGGGLVPMTWSDSVSFTTAGNNIPANSTVYINPAVTTISGSNNYYFTYLNTPTTTGATTGSAYTMYIAGAPTGTITTPYSLYVNSGNSLFGGNVNIGGTGSIFNTEFSSQANTCKILKLVNNNGGFVGAGSTSIDIGTYDYGVEAPSFRIQALDQDFGNDVYFRTKIRGANTNALQDNLILSSGSAGAANVTIPFMLFANQNFNPPTFTTRSTGTKHVLFNSLTDSNLDYALGIETDNMWFSSAIGFKWYNNSTSHSMQLTASGLNINTPVAINGTLTASSINTAGNILIQNTVVDGSPILRIRNLSSSSLAFSSAYISNDTANSFVAFLNSSQRLDDGGINCATIRNDAGALKLQNFGEQSTILLSGTTVNITAISPVINVVVGNAGDFISKQYANAQDRYGFGQYDDGTVRAFFSNGFSDATFRISKPTNTVKNGAATFTDLVTVNTIGNMSLTNTDPGFGNRTLLRLNTSESGDGTGGSIDFAQSGTVVGKINSKWEAASNFGLYFSTYTGGTLTERMSINSLGNVNMSGNLAVTNNSPVITVGTSGLEGGSLYFGNSSHGVFRDGSNNVVLYTTGGSSVIRSNGVDVIVCSSNAVDINRNTTLNGTLSITSTIASTGKTTGAAVISGGLGVGGAINNNINSVMNLLITSIPFNPTVYETGPAGPGGGAFWGGVLLPNGKVFLVPHSSSSTNVLYNPSTNLYETGPAGPGNGAFVGGVLLPNGKVFLVPHISTTTNVIYNPSTNLYETGPAGPGSGAFSGGVLLPNGKVFLVPYNTTSTNVIYNPSTNLYETGPTGPSGGAFPSFFQGGVLLPNGKVFLVPYNATTTNVIYNPSTNLYETGPAGPGNGAFSSGVLLPSGKVFLVPHRSTTTNVIYNPYTNLYETGPAGPGTDTFRGGVLLPNGKVFLVPYFNSAGNTNVIYNPFTNIYETGPASPGTGAAFAGGVLLPNAKVFLIPHSSTSTNVIYNTQVVGWPYGQWMLHAMFNKF